MMGGWTDWAVNLTACLCLGILFEVVRIRVMVDDIEHGRRDGTPGLRDEADEPRRDGEE